MATLLFVCLGYSAGAHGAVYKCTSETGGILFTDSACPQGYSTDLVVPDIPAPPPAAAPPRVEPEATAPSAPADESLQARVDRLEAEAKAARLEAELEVARLQAELDAQRLRSLEEQIDYTQPPVYGGIGVAPIIVGPGHFAPCKKGSRHCRPGRRDFKARVVPQERPSCGIVGCTPSIQRRLDRGDAPFADRRGRFAVEGRRLHDSRPGLHRSRPHRARP